jgi:hypothetical protein
VLSDVIKFFHRNLQSKRNYLIGPLFLNIGLGCDCFRESNALTYLRPSADLRTEKFCSLVPGLGNLDLQSSVSIIFHPTIFFSPMYNYKLQLYENSLALKPTIFAKAWPKGQCLYIDSVLKQFIY